MDLRQRVLADCDKGAATSDVAAKFSVSPAWVRRIKQRRRDGGELEPRKGHPGPARKLAGGGDEALRELARREPDLTAGEFRDRLGAAASIAAASTATVWRALRRMGLTFKKK